MTHRNARVFVVLALALHSLSTSQSQRTRLRQLPRQLKCEEGTCTSGDPSRDPLGEAPITTRYNCLLQSGDPGFQSYTNCEVLKKSETIQLWGLAYGKRVFVDLVALANVTTHQHGQVLEELKVLRGRLAAAHEEVDGGRS